MEFALTVPVGFIDVAAREGWLRSLGYWFLARRKYGNSAIYHFNFRGLGQLLGISHECARHHYKAWEKHGLVRTAGSKKNLRGTILTFCGKKEMDIVAHRNFYNEMTCLRRIKIRYFSDISSQLKCLQTRAILKNINQQIRNYTLRSEVLFYLNLPKAKRKLNGEEYRKWRWAERYVKANGKSSLKSTNGKIYLSDKRLSELVGCSPSYGKNLKKFLHQEGFLTITQERGQRLDTMSLQQFLLVKNYSEQFEQAFWCRGSVYSFPKTEYSVGSIVKPASFTAKVKVLAL